MVLPAEELDPGGLMLGSRGHQMKIFTKSLHESNDDPIEGCFDIVKVLVPWILPDCHDKF